MRCIFYVAFVFFIVSNESLQAQTGLEKGTVSYVSSKNVYVKFSSTKKINIGDTLFIKRGETLIPAIQVSNKSSVSCVCLRFIADTIRVSEEIFAKTIQVKEEEKVKNDKPDKENLKTKPADADKSPAQAVRDEDGVLEEKKPQQKIRARVSAATYSNFSDRGDQTRMRYSFTMQGNNLNNSKFSTDAYITFRHTLNDWEAVQANLNDALKIYSLSVKYDFSETSNLVLGRKINARISSLGSIDGVQYEKGIGNNFLLGAIAGSRPDMRDYSVNTDLLQAGVYVGQVSGKSKKYQQTTLGIIEQRNKSAVDRRFVYFQHSDDLLKNVNIFTSCELDLYEKINNETNNKLSLTNLFASIRYRFSRKFNASLSYDNRKNIIYYESYKNYIDQLIDDETRQGLRAGANFQPIGFIMWGINASWRFQKNNTNESKNINSYLNFNRIPVIKASASLTANYLQTSYINSRVFGVRMTKDIFKGKVNGEVYYRKVNYFYPIYGYSTKQNIVGGNISWQVMKHLSLYTFVEKTFDSQHNDYMMVNTKIMYRF